MDVWEKLVELQMQAKIGWTKEEFADHLIAHGVTVQDNTKISDEFLEQLRNAPVTILQEEPTIEVMQEWISVKDRLPEKWQNVLSVDEHGKVCFDYIFANGSWYYNRNVTHWMPLPQPPKGE